MQLNRRLQIRSALLGAVLAAAADPCRAPIVTPGAALAFIRRHGIVLACTLLGAPGLRAQNPDASQRYVTTGIFIASIEEGARIFTPVRLLPFGHPEALQHQFPTVQQMHGGEDEVLTAIGQAAGLRLTATLQRYPTQPDSLWPYAPFEPPPVAAVRAAPVVTRGAAEAPLPGLRAVAFIDRFPLSFIVDTRGLSLASRRLQGPTTMGLDISRADFVSALAAAAQLVPERGAAVLVFRP